MNWSNSWSKPTILTQPIELTIPLKNKWPKKVKALRLSNLAVHEAINDSNVAYAWQVTHIPTLTCFDAALPEGDWTQEQLVKWCWQVQQERNDLWEALNKYNKDNWKTVDRILLDLILEHCSNFEIPGEAPQIGER